MGCTHYYYQYQSFSKPQWDLIRSGVQKILDFSKESGIHLVGAQEFLGEPIVNKNIIAFNGYGCKGCDPFYLPQIMTPISPNARQKDCKFYSCKTNRMPYDSAVCLSLLHIKSIAPENLKIMSDLKWDSDWVPVREAYVKLFGQEPLPLDPSDAH